MIFYGGYYWLSVESIPAHFGGLYIVADEIYTRVNWTTVWLALWRMAWRLMQALPALVALFIAGVALQDGAGRKREGRQMTLWDMRRVA